jgi:hypothetical protein
MTRIARTFLLSVALGTLVCTSCGDDEPSPTVPTDTIPPAAITDLAVIDGAAGSLTLTWTASGEDGVLGTAAVYDLRYSSSPITLAGWDSATAAEGELAPREAGRAETLLVEGLVADSSYFFALRTSDDHGNVSGLSNIVSAVASSNPNAPAAVTDLAATPSATSLITLTWTAPGADGRIGRADQYDLRYSTTPITAQSWLTATRLGGEPRPKPAGEDETFEVFLLAEETVYYFALRTKDIDGLVSGLSNVVSSAAQPDTIPPGRVEDLAGTIGSPTSVALSWTMPGDDGFTGSATRYEIRVSSEAIDESTWENARSIDSLPAPPPGGAMASFLVGGLANDSTYYFALRAADNALNWSPVSNVAVAGPLIDDVPPSRVVNLGGAPIGGMTVRIRWSAPGDDGCDGAASAYEIRFASTPISEETWSTAVLVPNTLVPAQCGEEETLTFDVSSDTTLFFIALRSLDDHGNISPISNVIAIDLTLAEGDAHWNVTMGQYTPDPRYGGGSFYAVEADADGVVVGGVFGTIDGIEMNCVALWSGGRWNPMSGGFTSDAIQPAVIVRSTLYSGAVVVCGYTFWRLSLTDRTRPILHLWDGTRWISQGPLSGSLDGRVDVASGAGSYLYFAGETCDGLIEDIEGSCDRYIARRSDAGREIIGTPNGVVLAIAEHQGSIVVGGDFSSIDSVAVNRVAMWDGKTWTAMGSGLDGAVRALVSDSDRLIAGGDFRTAGGVTVEHIAEWDGASWQLIGDGLGGDGAFVSSMAFHEGALIAAGRIPQWETRRINNIARWDGTQWRGLGSGTDRTITDITSYDGVLYVVGLFDSAGGKATNSIATWEE